MKTNTYAFVNGPFHGVLTCQHEFPPGACIQLAITEKPAEHPHLPDQHVDITHCAYKLDENSHFNKTSST